MTIDAVTDNVTHHGSVGTVNVVAVASTSYHENGAANEIVMTKGNLVVEATAFVGEVKKATDANIDSITAIVKGTITKVNSNVSNSVDATEGTVLIDSNGVFDTTKVIKVSTAEALMNLAFAQSTGVFKDPVQTTESKALIISIEADIDLTGKTWIPFGAEYETQHYMFSGTIDGNEHKIIGLSDDGYEGKFTTTQFTGITGFTFGFIAFAKGNVTVKNIIFTNVNINNDDIKECGAVIGKTDVNTLNNILISNVTVDGTVRGKDKVGGIIGCYYGKQNAKDANGNNVYAEAIISNCTNNANITAKSYRAGGIVGYSSHVKLDVDNCTNKGDIEIITAHSKGKWSGALIGGALNTEIKITDFTNSGEVGENSGKDGNGSPEYRLKVNDQCIIGDVCNSFKFHITYTYNDTTIRYNNTEDDWDIKGTTTSYDQIGEETNNGLTVIVAE